MTERAEHTEGPWKQQCFLVTGTDGSWVCHTGMGNLPPSRSHESEANARLIAAAPDLLAALKALQLQALQSTVNDPANEWGQEALELTRAAISKAKGEA